MQAIAAPEGLAIFALGDRVRVTMPTAAGWGNPNAFANANAAAVRVNGSGCGRAVCASSRGAALKLHSNAALLLLLITRVSFVIIVWSDVSRSHASLPKSTFQ